MSGRDYLTFSLILLIIGSGASALQLSPVILIFEATSHSSVTQRC